MGSQEETKKLQTSKTAEESQNQPLHTKTAQDEDSQEENMDDEEEGENFDDDEDDEH